MCSWGEGAGLSLGFKKQKEELNNNYKIKNKICHSVHILDILP